MFGWLFGFWSACDSKSHSERVRERQARREARSARRLVRQHIADARRAGRRTATVWSDLLIPSEIHQPILEELKGLGYNVESHLRPSVSILGTVSYAPYITIGW